MANFQLMNLLKNYDISHITPALRNSCRKIIHENGITFAAARGCSQAVGGMYTWVVALVGLPSIPKGMKLEAPIEEVKVKLQRPKPVVPAQVVMPAHTPEEAATIQQSGALDTITKGDIIELKSLKAPPEQVKTVI